MGIAHPTDPNVEWAGPVCYLCDEPIREGQLACELDVEGEREDAHRTCVDAYFTRELEDTPVKGLPH